METKPADALPEATNASQIAMAESAQQTFEEVASQAYLAMRKTQSAGGEWRGISEILKKAASVAQNGDFKRATRLAENAQEKAEEAYKRAKAKN